MCVWKRERERERAQLVVVAVQRVRECTYNYQTTALSEWMYDRGRRYFSRKLAYLKKQEKIKRPSLLLNDRAISWNKEAHRGY